MAFSEGQGPSYLMKCRIGLDGTWQSIPDRLCELLGYSRRELKQQEFDDIFEPAYQVENEKLIHRIQQNNLREFEQEMCGRTNSGDFVWLYVSGALIKDDKGNPQYVVCYIHDVTKNKQHEQKLKASEQKFRSLFQHNPDPAYYFDLEGNFEGVNQKLVDFTGYSREELLKLNFKDFIVEEDLERTKDYFDKAVEGITGEYEIRVRVKDGEKDIRVKKFPMYVGEQVTGVFGIFHDITEEKQARKELKESEERWHRLLNNNPQPLQVTRDAEIIFINQSGAELYGADSPSDLMGVSVFNFCTDDDIEKVKKRKRELEQGNEVPEVFEQEIHRLDGKNRFVEVYSIPITYQGNPAIQTVLHDITGRRAKEQIIRDSLNEKETLLKEIHHRVKNNLAVISGLLELQAMNATETSTINTLRDSQHRISSIAMIHEKLYQSEALSKIGFDAYLRELVQSISQTYTTETDNIDVVFELRPASLRLEKAIPCSLIVNEVIVNCYKHAFEDHSKGTIYIASRLDDSELSILIKDNGKGLPEDFDIDSQQSLGMTLIQTLAQQLDGEISFSSNGDDGTHFELRFATSQ